MNHPLSRRVSVTFTCIITSLATLQLTAVTVASANEAIRYDSELETPAGHFTGVGNSNGDAAVAISFKNGFVKIMPSDQTEKTIKLHTQIFTNSQGEGKPVYDSSFSTNLNMTAELKESRPDGTLIYFLKLTPRTGQK